MAVEPVMHAKETTPSRFGTYPKPYPRPRWDILWKILAALKHAQIEVHLRPHPVVATSDAPSCCNRQWSRARIA